MAQTMLRDYLQQTEDALSSGRIKDALANCQYILTHYPESLEVQRLLGEVYLAQGHLEDAQQSFDWVLTSDPENVVAYCDRALISERMSDFDTALDCYQQAYELSRGNSQIRQEFNQLSVKVGQPHFMFSRAGLARLYMRGDLLLQAIQEWESVLTATPDRLDARTGLLEALWREGFNDRVEQLAKQILNEIPSCLKALLLLAYVTSTHNTTQARELIRQAEALDPELVMAHELFSDMMARQPNDPFLALIRKDPITLPDVTDSPLATTTTSGSEITNGTSSPLLSADPLFGWSSLDPIVSPQKDYQEPPEQTIWSSSDQQIFDSKRAESKDIDVPTPPAWLDMLTQGERGPSSGASLPVSPLPPSAPIEQEPFVAMPPDPTPVEPEAQVLHEEISQTAPLSPHTFAPEDSDAANWPEWLKSLGATEIENESVTDVPAMEPEPQQPPYVQSWMEQAASQPAPQVPSPAWSEQIAEPSAEQAPPTWMNQMAAPFAQQVPSPARSDQIAESSDEQTSPTWMNQADEPPTEEPSPVWMGRMTRSFPEPTQPTFTTLENLEQSLHTQGFVELAPGSLSTIAQSTHEPTLSSALAQLGNVNLPLTEQPTMPPQDTSAVSSTIVPPAQPSRFVAAPPNPVTDPAPSPITNIAPKPPMEHSVIPPYRADALLENELETTMKRPAIRLQPMQQRPTVQRDTASLIGQERSGEHLATSGTAEGQLSPREHLLRGYQYQLAGDYDEAMQEYRIIIRSTSELLGEVISNVRALLKLTPKYSAGYRVLGDAYMRQGEYLQAMEAYNKALSMTKKAKG